MTDRLHLSPRHRTVLLSLLQKHLPGVEVWAYGSRVNGRSHDGSDLDLVLRGPGSTEIPIGQLVDFEEGVRESRIPFLVEARDWSRLPERFHGEIERDHVVLDIGKPATTHIVEGAGGRDDEVIADKLREPGYGGERSLFYTRDLIADDLLEIGDGYRAKNSEMGDSGLPFVRARDVNGRVNTVGTDILAVESLSKIGAKRSNPGDVVITTKGTVGRMAFIADGDPPFVYSPQLCYWRSKDKGAIYPRWLFYALQSKELKHQMDWSAAQTDMAPYISLTDQRNAFYLTTPPISEQRAIAHILGTLDDKIEVNRRMNATLETMARAIFKDWFVDFGPTRAKMAVRKPYLTPKIWDLFPDKIDNDGKPEGWTREMIANHIIAQKGLSYKGAYLTDEANGLPLHNLNSVLEGGGYKNDGLKFYSGSYKPRHIARPGDLIVANTEQGFDHLLIGYSALLPAWVGTEGLFSHHTFKVEPRLNSPFSRTWLHFALSASRFGESVRRFSNGTTVNMLPPDAFELPKIIVPPIELVRAFDKIAEPMLHKQEDAVGESRTLAQIRDLLLPKLISG